jgi:hypothetical protein
MYKGNAGQLDKCCSKSMWLEEYTAAAAGEKSTRATQVIQNQGSINNKWLVSILATTCGLG